MTMTDTKISFGDITLTQGSNQFDQKQTWLLKGLISQHSFGVLYGPPDSLKSFTAIDLACSIATGKPWNDRSTKQGAVIYLASEGQQGFSRRAKAWELANKIEAKNLWVLGSNLTLSNIKEQRQLIGAIRHLEETQEIKVELLIIDTLARCMEGDENSPKDMSKFVSACDDIRFATGVSIMCIHHAGKDVNKGARGSNALIAAADYEFKMSKTKEKGLVKLTNTKQKDADIAPPITLRYEPIDLGITCDEGFPITSLVRLDNDIQNTQKAVHNNGDILEIIMKSPLQSITRNELNQALYPSIDSIPANERQKVKRKLDKLVENQFVTIEKRGKNSSGTDLISIIH